MTDRTARSGMSYRYVTDEPDIPFHYTILFENARVIVIDKPHFLATTPRGMWYHNTALIQLREETGNQDLIPAHRLDRQTAGIILFVKHANDRGAYQLKFQNREVSKVYECLAPRDPNMLFPQTIQSYIKKDVGTLQAYEVENKQPNARTYIELKQEKDFTTDDYAALKQHPHSAIYVLHPHTGKTHQLRVHMNRLGLPILGDDLYPIIQNRAYNDFSTPLELVARTLEMDDPITGEHWVFTSRIPL